MSDEGGCQGRRNHDRTLIHVELNVLRKDNDEMSFLAISNNGKGKQPQICTCKNTNMYSATGTCGLYHLILSSP